MQFLLFLSSAFQFVEAVTSDIRLHPGLYKCHKWEGMDLSCAVSFLGMPHSTGKFRGGSRMTCR